MIVKVVYNRQAMKIYSVLILFVSLLLLLNCDRVVNPFLPNIKPPADQLTWVAHFYSGGVQCSPYIEYKPPNIEFILGSRGIYVFETIIEPHGVCLSCDCPSYAAMHYALILKVDLARAINLGFQEMTPPQDL